MSNHACQEVMDVLAVGASDEREQARVEAHAGHCTTCRARVEAQSRLVAALRGVAVGADEISRARWLVQMAPQVDEIASSNAIRATKRSARGWQWKLIPAMTFATAAAGAILLWTQRGGHSVVPVAPMVAPPKSPNTPVAADRDVIRPYAVTGAVDATVASTLLAGRFSALDVHAGETVRATLADGQQIDLIGPGQLVVASVTNAGTELVVSQGTLVIDTGTATQPLHLRGGAFDVVAQDARFAAYVSVDGSPIIVVDRGELALSDGTTIRAGQSTGLDEARTTALTSMLRDGKPTQIAIVAPAPVVETADQVHRPVRHVEKLAAAMPAVATDSATSDVKPESAADMYVRAEAALGSDRKQAAATIMEVLVERFPDSPQAVSAMYDLAGIAGSAGDAATAQGWLARVLASSGGTSLREPAMYRSCRISVDSGDAVTAKKCLLQFRDEFPASAHDAEVLAWLTGAAEHVGDCVAAQRFGEEYLRRYPNGAFAARARSACNGARSE